MSRRILLADDSVTIQKVIELTFMDEDLEVTAVSNGDEALAKLAEMQPDLVIADVHMPGANGYEVCRRAKASRPGLPVLLLVGTFEPFDEGEARAAGSDAHLKKPFDSQELLSLVQQLLERAPAAGAVPAASAQPAAGTLPAAGAQPAAGALPATAFAAPAAGALSFEELPTPDHAWEGFDLHAAPPAPAAAAPAAAPAAAAPDAAAPVAQAPPSVWAPPPPAPPPAQQTAEPAGAGRSAGFDWAETARFGRVDEPTFELEDTGEALGLDDSLLEDEPAPAAGHAAHEIDEPFDLSAFESPSLASLATEADILPEPATAAPQPTLWPPASFEERAGVPSGSLPLTGGLADIEEHVHRAEERHEQPLSGGYGMPAPSEPPAGDRTGASPGAAPSLGAVSLPVQLSDHEIDRIARRVVELLGDKAVRDVAWEVIPDMAEVVIKDRLRELESQVE